MVCVFVWVCSVYFMSYVVSCVCCCQCDCMSGDESSHGCLVSLLFDVSQKMFVICVVVVCLSGLCVMVCVCFVQV